MVVAADRVSKRGLEMEVLSMRGEEICLKAEFGELAHCFYLNLFEMMGIIGKLKFTPILKSLISITMGFGVSGKILWVT